MPFDISQQERMSADGSEADASWRAELRCDFEQHAGRTVIARRDHRGPLLVQRAFYPEDDGTCHVLLIHPPGGIVGGDRLRFDASLAAGSQALITTPAATKLYRSNGMTAEQHTQLQVRAGASLEWLPQETLIYGGAVGEISTRVVLQPRARFLGWEVACLGRPAAGERFHSGRLRQRFEIWRAADSTITPEGPLWIERSEYLGDDELLSQAWGLGGEPVFGTLVAVMDEPDRAVSEVRAAMHAVDAPGRSVATALDNVLVCRYVGPWAEAARAHLIAAWRVLRPMVMGRSAHVPRIWNT